MCTCEYSVHMYIPFFAVLHGTPLYECAGIYLANSISASVTCIYF